jgi:glutathione S-transferase
VHANAIMRYLARKANLYGTNPKQMAACDMWVRACEPRIAFPADDVETYHTKMEQLEEVQQALWNADFMKKVYQLEQPLYESTAPFSHRRSQECSEFKEMQLKNDFQNEYLNEALAGICNVMAKNETMYLVGNKVSFPLLLQCRL